MASFTKQSPAGWPVLAGLVGLLLGGCVLPAGSRMAPPADIAPTAVVMDTTGRSAARGLLVDESFDLGAFQVRAVKRGGTSSTSHSLGALSAASSRERFSFRFIGREQWLGRCELRTKDEFLQVKAVTLESRHAQLDCSCESGSERVSVLLEDEGRPLRGEMRIGDARYAMQQYRFGNSEGGLRSPAVGYRVETQDDGAGIAAVELLHPGRVWQQRSLPEPQREPMACLLTALMLHGSP